MLRQSSAFSWPLTFLYFFCLLVFDLPDSVDLLEPPDLLESLDLLGSLELDSSLAFLLMTTLGILYV